MAASKTLVLLSLLAALCAREAGAQETLRGIAIKTPGRCEVFDRFEPPNRVHLVTPAKCPQHVGFIEARVPLALAQVEIYLDGAYLSTQGVESFGLGAIHQVFERSTALEKNLEAAGLEAQNAQAKERARALDERINTPSYRARIEAERSRIEREIFPEQFELSRAHQAAEARAEEAGAALLAHDERIYLFISSSMPRQTLANYIRVLDKVADPNVTLVLRGLIGGAQRISPTIAFFSTVLAKDPACDPLADPAKGCEAYRVGLVVDPLLYQRFGVTKVPTLVYARGVDRRGGNPEGSEGLVEQVALSESWAVSGDEALDRLLERINAEAQSETLGGYVAALRQGFH
ncbi:TrbC family F-type conjugative pilus assembly protein [Geoalkalibacter sp.]|uniref:TrbC family F-type conjugative pilus assembly protein n=1 Tax=Geoalkalibacter sp. TaxID=3041440 RepID=UPI00272E3DAE|nr:TrbC family F-type conjugative pilus assembly protein [Geoalkalibacter sp.]